MCSYPRVNGQYACENSHLLEDVLKGDWGFKGFVLTDYGAAKNAVDSLNNGLDLDIWPALALNPVNVKAAVTAGLVSRATIDEHVRRQLRTLFAFGFFDRDAYATTRRRSTGTPTTRPRPTWSSRASCCSRTGLAAAARRERVGKVALIGPEADRLKDGGGSSAIDEFKTTTPRQAIEAKLGAGRVTFADGSDRAKAVDAARDAEVAIVVVGDQMTEGADKACMGLNCSQTDRIDRDALIEAVAAAQPRTVVLLQSGGPVLTPWREKVPALVEAWFPGQNGGTAMARVLFGDAEPRRPAAGHLPGQRGRRADLRRPGEVPGRRRDRALQGGRPHRLPLVRRDGQGRRLPVRIRAELHDVRLPRPARERSSDASRVVVSAVVTNTGKRTGTAVPQLYVGMPDPAPGVVQPPFQLKGFQKVALAPGQAKRVRFSLDSRAFSYWAGSAGAWLPAATASASARTRATCRSGEPSAVARCARARCGWPPMHCGSRCRRGGCASARACGSASPFAAWAVRCGGALVTIAGRRVRTDRRGRASLRVRFGQARAYTVRATRSGYAPDTDRVRAVRAARFTG